MLTIKNTLLLRKLTLEALKHMCRTALQYGEWSPGDVGTHSAVSMHVSSLWALHPVEGRQLQFDWPGNSLQQ